MSDSAHAADDSAKPASTAQPAGPGQEPIRRHLADPAATEAFGAALAPAMEAGLVVWLSGDLGAGKTTLTRGLLRALGHTGNVKSPTYTLLEPYTVSRIPLYHFDFYRFTHADEFLEAGLDEYFTGTGACLVEWADKARPHVPLPDIELRLHVVAHGGGIDGRDIECLALTERGRACLSRTTI
ncbi:tRNA (adenosine(37)-N6)-threonylcarbamoyltransferase complex ATPase subunit type 1 TsaE [Uliginosibacterium sp. H1]|uniref:tRNA (adenosine(37)-N6)-threonylcarbamoyltransferase complex ATPase subunit type 1 TsaE n=1 Tax=Uliginosibacterium sp. H1 TaxID=3114757 RepID=UPI002E17590A|nr:tRNA (adenosine(37)-N6)-threonylcarbamoyltransferase complex ATPase subunit type 1 TsaE [Uliginosibacterium sp. H1]